MKDIRFSKLVLFVNSLVPLTLLLWDWYHKNVGANPLEFVTRTTGMLTLVFLLITLAITPLRKITGINWPVKFRRMLGLYAFFYGSLHLFTYLWFDRSFNFSSMDRFSADGAAGNHLNEQNGQTAGRKTLEQASSAGVRCRRRRRRPLLDAGKVGYTPPFDLWLHPISAIGTSRVH